MLVFQGKAVRGLRREDLLQWPQDLDCDWTPQTHLPTFKEFNTSCAKTQQLTVREMLAKHLLQMHGLSVDKARAVVDQVGYKYVCHYEDDKRLLNFPSS